MLFYLDDERVLALKRHETNVNDQDERFKTPLRYTAASGIHLNIHLINLLIYSPHKHCVQCFVLFWFGYYDEDEPEDKHKLEEEDEDEGDDVDEFQDEDEFIKWSPLHMASLEGKFHLEWKCEQYDFDVNVRF